MSTEHKELLNLVRQIKIDLLALESRLLKETAKPVGKLKPVKEG